MGKVSQVDRILIRQCIARIFPEGGGISKQKLPIDPTQAIETEPTEIQIA